MGMGRKEELRRRFVPGRGRIIWGGWRVEDIKEEEKEVLG